MELIRTYTLTAAALALWLILGVIFSFSDLLFGIAIGAFVFEQNLAPQLAAQIRRLVKLD